MGLALPFSHDAFLDVFGAYNAAFWPVVVVLWLVTAALAVRWTLAGPVNRRGAFALLAVHWAWSGVAYHWYYFRPINPAATLFGALFVLQAVIFSGLAIMTRATSEARGRTRRLVGGALVGYGLAYPFIGFALGLQYPRMPLFAVPCPTTLVTVGLLLTMPGVPRAAKIVPILWALVASSAAFQLGIVADLALVVAAALLALDTLVPSALRGQHAHTPAHRR